MGGTGCINDGLKVGGGVIEIYGLASPAYTKFIHAVEGQAELRLPLESLNFGSDTSERHKGRYYKDLPVRLTPDRRRKQ